MTHAGDAELDQHTLPAYTFISVYYQYDVDTHG